MAAIDSLPLFSSLFLVLLPTAQRYVSPINLDGTLILGFPHHLNTYTIT